MRHRLSYGSIAFMVLFGCSTRPSASESDAGTSSDAAPFVCTTEGSFCSSDVAISCELQGGLLLQVRDDCSLRNERCNAGECVSCIPDSLGCFEGNAARCRSDSSGWDVTQPCDFAAGEACDLGTCIDLCTRAIENKSYQGCEFYPVDLDTKGAHEASFGIIVSNPNPFPTTVSLEVDDSSPGQSPSIRSIREAVIPPFDLETFVLERRRIDGVFTDETFTETHSALTRRAYRVRAHHPVNAYQFNPLQSADVFSNDASLLLPTSAIGTKTTVIGWPQTLSTRGTAEQRGEDNFRSTLTIVGTEAETSVSIRFGPAVGSVIGIGDVSAWQPGDMARFNLGPFEVLNLETDAFLGDFTGTTLESNHGVVVYTGSEGADVPTFQRIANRLCCADHLEEQLLPDRALGRQFLLARTPARASSINDALNDPSLSLPVTNELEYTRIVAVAPGTTTITTTLPAPFTAFTLQQGESATLALDRDIQITSSNPISVIQMIAGQYAVGIPIDYPGGDPAMIVVPPIAQFRRDYVFLTPATYAFDAITLIASPDTTIRLDGSSLPTTCETVPLDGVERRAGDPPPTWVVHRCALSFPEFDGLTIRPGVQGDGVHRIRADQPVGVVVSGFDAFVSYAYAAGMNLQELR